VTGKEESIKQDPNKNPAASKQIDLACIPKEPYLLLTPGPLTTTKSVRAAMLRDWCTWDDDYNSMVQEVRHNLVRLATRNPASYTSVLMQGSGTFSVEAALGTFVPREGHVCFPINGAYGRRMVTIADRLGTSKTVIPFDENEIIDPNKLEKMLEYDRSITHVALVHCETTTGILNPLEAVADVVKARGKTLIVDAMSSFGGIPMDVADLGIDVCISSSNKCIQGAPGFGFVIARKPVLEEAEGRSRSLALDLYDQWKTMEGANGKWRFTSPTHCVHAFRQALLELEEEGGVEARNLRYSENQSILVEEMERIGFRAFIPREHQSPIITAFLSPDSSDFSFQLLYSHLKTGGFVIYPGKLTAVDTFRIGTIGNVFPDDIRRLVRTIEESRFLVPNFQGKN
jgi:2-aminoethylphosphonate-pyruvate transaminase